MKNHKNEPSIFILQLLASFAIVSAVLFTPALPEITQKLGLSDSQAMWTMTAFLLGYSIGNLPYGPISNRLGRKPTLYLGILIAILGSLLTVLVDKFPIFQLLVVGRFLMALGSTVGLQIAFTMIGDVYQHHKATKKAAALMMIFAVGPGVATAIGGLLTKHFGWPSCFYFLMGYSIFLLFLSSILPETCKKHDPQALNLKKIKDGYLHILKNSKFTTCALLMGCGTSFVYLFSSEAPFIGINTIGLTAAQYGLLNIIPPIGVIIGSTLAHIFAGKKEVALVILLGIFSALSAAIVMLLLFLFGIVNLWSLFMPMPFVLIGQAMVTSNVSAMALGHSQNKSYASGMLNFINMATSFVFLLLAGAMDIQKTLLLPILLCVVGIFMLLLTKILRVAN